MTRIKELTINEVEYVTFYLARRWMAFNEPIPDFHTRFPNKLESCLATPFQKFNHKSLYQGLSGRGAILFYLLVKNHPFQNGNKRIAMTTLLVFLYKNGKWLKVDQKEFYNFAMWIAQSPAGANEETVRYTEKFIKKNLVNLN